MVLLSHEGYSTVDEQIYYSQNEESMSVAFKNIFFIYLTVLGLPFSMQDLCPDSSWFSDAL